MRLSATAVLLAVLGTWGAAPASAQDNAVATGQKLYADQKCSMCHSIGATGGTKVALDEVGSKLSDEDIRQWLINPKVMAEKTKSTRKPLMPSYAKLTKEQVESLVAYLKTLKKK